MGLEMFSKQMWRTERAAGVERGGPDFRRKGCLCFCTLALIGLSAAASRLKRTDLNIRSLLGLNVPPSYKDLVSKVTSGAF